MTDVAAVSIETLAEEMFQLVTECAGKKNLKAGDLSKAMIAKHGEQACSKDDCKKAIRILIDSGRYDPNCLLGRFPSGLGYAPEHRRRSPPRGRRASGHAGGGRGCPVA